MNDIFSGRPNLRIHGRGQVPGLTPRQPEEELAALLTGLRRGGGLGGRMGMLSIGGRPMAGVGSAEGAGGADEGEGAKGGGAGEGEAGGATGGAATAVAGADAFMAALKQRRASHLAAGQAKILAAGGLGRPIRMNGFARQLGQLQLQGGGPGMGGFPRSRRMFSRRAA